jgi:hypothetical protein
MGAAVSCVWETNLPQNAGTTTISLSGTFTGARLVVEESNNGGSTWNTAAMLSAAGTTTYSTNGFSDIRVRASALSSGTVVVQISTGLLQVQSVVSGSGSEHKPSNKPAYYLHARNHCSRSAHRAPYGIYVCTATNTWTLDSAISGAIIRQSYSVKPNGKWNVGIDLARASL